MRHASVVGSVAAAVAAGVAAGAAGIDRPVRAAGLVLLLLLGVRLGIVRTRADRRRAQQGPVAPATSVPTQDRFVLVEPLTATDPRWEVRSTSDALLATGEARFFAVRDETTFYADDARMQPMFSIRRRSAVDPRVRTEVVAADGRPLGTLAKRPFPGPLRIRWTLEREGVRFVVVERSFGRAIRRRLSVLPPVELECRRGDGTVVLRASRRRGIVDRYDVELDGDDLPFPLAVAAVVVPHDHHDL